MTANGKKTSWLIFRSATNSRHRRIGRERESEREYTYQLPPDTDVENKRPANETRNNKSQPSIYIKKPSSNRAIFIPTQTVAHIFICFVVKCQAFAHHHENPYTRIRNNYTQSRRVRCVFLWLRTSFIGLCEHTECTLCTFFFPSYFFPSTFPRLNSQFNFYLRILFIISFILLHYAMCCTSFYTNWISTGILASNHFSGIIVRVLCPSSFWPNRNVSV